MDKLRGRLEAQLDSNKTELKSGLVKAIPYMLRHWKARFRGDRVRRLFAKPQQNTHELLLHHLPRKLLIGRGVLSPGLSLRSATLGERMLER
jgi:hypothetical protein